MRTQRLIADRYSLVEPLPGSATGVGWRAQDLWWPAQAARAARAGVAADGHRPRGGAAEADVVGDQQMSRSWPIGQDGFAWNNQS